MIKKLSFFFILLFMAALLTGCEAVGDSSDGSQEETGGELIEEAKKEQEREANKPKVYSADTQNKFITIRYRKADGSVEDVYVQTKAGDLLTALEREGLGTESTAYPGTFARVGDYTVDEANGQAWIFAVNDEYIDLPPSQIVVNNGDYIFIDLNYY